MFVKNNLHLFKTIGYHVYKTMNRNKFEKVMQKKIPCYSCVDVFEKILNSIKCLTNNLLKCR